MSVDVTSDIYHDEAAARAHLEAQRWPAVPACPHRGVVDNATRLVGRIQDGGTASPTASNPMCDPRCQQRRTARLSPPGSHSVTRSGTSACAIR